MNQFLVKTALFVRDLLSYDEQLIKIGRQNYEITDFTTGYIGVDMLAPARRTASSQTYDGDTEVMSHSQRWSAPIVLSFYGDNAWQTATNFSLLVKTQSAYELQLTHQVAIFQVSNLTDVKILTGQEYGERVELNLNVNSTLSTDVNVLRIDTAQIDIISENGQELSS